MIKPAIQELAWGLQKKMGASPIKPFSIAGYFLMLNIDESIQRRIYFGGFETVETQWIYKILKPGMCFVDAGCNIGYYSLIASAIVGNSGRVYSFDPSKYACEKLSRIISDNNITNIKVICEGLGDHETSLSLRRRVDDMHSPSFCYPDINGELEHLGESKINTLDMFSELNHIDSIDLIKIDVEGYEPNVIKGMSKLLGSGRVKRIMIELNAGWLVCNNSTPKIVDAMIRDYGYTVEMQNIITGEESNIDMANRMYVLKEGSS